MEFPLGLERRRAQLPQRPKHAPILEGYRDLPDQEPAQAHRGQQGRSTRASAASTARASRDQGARGLYDAGLQLLRAAADARRLLRRALQVANEFVARPARGPEAFAAAACRARARVPELLPPATSSTRPNPAPGTRGAGAMYGASQPGDVAVHASPMPTVASAWSTSTRPSRRARSSIPRPARASRSSRCPKRPVTHAGRPAGAGGAGALAWTAPRRRRTLALSSAGLFARGPLFAAGCARRAHWNGAVAQLGERVVRNDEVRGSIPLGSTSALMRQLLAPASDDGLELVRRSRGPSRRDEAILAHWTRRHSCISSTRPRSTCVGRRRPGRGQLPAREVCRVRRARRRRRRQGRRHRLRGGARPQHADRLPLHPAFQGPARRRRHGQEPHRRGAPRPGHQGAGRHPDLRRRPGDAARRPHRSRPARGPARRRHGRARQRQLQDLDQPRPAPAPAGHGRRRRCGSGCG